MYALRMFITQIRTRQGLPQQAVAAALGVTPAAVSAWESERSQRIPSARHFSKLMDVCGVRKAQDQIKAWRLYAAADADQAGEEAGQQVAA